MQDIRIGFYIDAEIQVDSVCTIQEPLHEYFGFIQGIEDGQGIIQLMETIKLILSNYPYFYNSQQNLNLYYLSSSYTNQQSKHHKNQRYTLFSIISNLIILTNYLVKNFFSYLLPVQPQMYQQNKYSPHQQNTIDNQYRYSNKFDYSFKFILVGDTGVGKTSIISRFVDGSFHPNHQYTIGVQYGSKNIAIANKIIKLQIWDTAGQEQFRAITRSYYRSSAAALVVFDLTRKQTFRSVTRWVQDVKNNSNKDVFMVLIGNKNDLIQQRMVSRNEAVKLAKDYQMLYMQTSAKNQQNIERAFVWPATNILDKVEGGFIQVNRQDQAIKVNRFNQNRIPQQKQCQC